MEKLEWKMTKKCLQNNSIPLLDTNTLYVVLVLVENEMAYTRQHKGCELTLHTEIIVNSKMEWHVLGTKGSDEWKLKGLLKNYEN